MQTRKTLSLMGQSRPGTAISMMTVAGCGGACGASACACVAAAALSLPVFCGGSDTSVAGGTNPPELCVSSAGVSESDDSSVLVSLLNKAQTL